MGSSTLPLRVTDQHIISYSLKEPLPIIFNVLYYYVECGDDIRNGTSGTITSPGYPGSYPINRTCVWTIRVPAGNNIKLVFSFLDLEHHPNCSYDYLEVCRLLHFCQSICQMIHRLHTLRPHSLRPYSLRPHSLRPHTLRTDTLRPHSLRPHTLKPSHTETTAYWDHPTMRSFKLRPHNEAAHIETTPH